MAPPDNKGGAIGTPGGTSAGEVAPAGRVESGQLPEPTAVVRAKDPDAMLVRACLAGDATAYEGLVHRYSGPLFNAAYRITHSREDAVDATQSAFVKAWERLDRFDFSHRFFSWIYRIAVNEALDLVGRRRREARLNEGVTEPLLDPTAERSDQERMELLLRALKELKAGERAIIVLKHIRGLSYAEIGEVLEISEAKVKSRLFEARERLRGLMRRRGWLP